MKILQSDVRTALDELTEMVHDGEREIECPDWARSAYDVISAIRYVDEEGGSITIVRDLTNHPRIPKEVTV